AGKPIAFHSKAVYLHYPVDEPEQMLLPRATRHTCSSIKNLSQLCQPIGCNHKSYSLLGDPILPNAVCRYLK
ncbi:MAG TPA: hypothetical protein VEL11_01180, partial [Candidatus Bathyarchaeia archaeon]|nr:hypothetical protein [Candidatus Bathyarchaeia archaeon]